MRSVLKWVWPFCYCLSKYAVCWLFLGTYINILKPHDQPDVWIDRKGHHSLNCAAVVDGQRRFIAAALGCPGSFHDGRVYRVSELDEKISSLPDDFHVIGDSAYGLQTHLIVPYRDNNNLTQQQLTFNYKHSSNRMVVENCFGIMKMKFPRVQSKLLVHSWNRAVAIVMCCMQLHNFIQRLENCDNDSSETYNSIPLPLEPKARRDALKDLLTSTLWQENSFMVPTVYHLLCSFAWCYKFVTFWMLSTVTFVF